MKKKTAKSGGAVCKPRSADSSVAEKIRRAKPGVHRQVEEELKMYRDQLEALVSERTLELELTNRRLEEEINRHRHSEILQSALYQISEKASQAKDMDALYKAIHGIISSLLYARNFYIALTDTSGEMLSFPYFLDEFDPRPQSRKLRRGLTEYVLKTGQPLLASDQQVEQMAQDGLIELISAPSSEWLGVPLKRGERAFGVLVIQSYHEDFHYSEMDRELLIFVSQNIADALWYKQTARELAVSERRYRTLFEESQDVIYMADIDGNLIDINQAGVELFGYASRQELLQVNISRDLYENSQDWEKFLAAILISGHVKDYEVNLKTKSGKAVVVLITAGVEHNESDRVIGYRGIMRDSTERKLLEQRYLQAQKMESIGQLAGGIAHDFNNILSSYGYRVQLAADGEDGVKIYEKQEPRSDLVILDMIMPKQGSRETFLKLKKINPAIKVLFSTGYSQNEKVNEILALEVRGFIQKPYQVRDLLVKVREILDARS